MQCRKSLAPSGYHQRYRLRLLALTNTPLLIALMLMACFSQTIADDSGAASDAAAYRQWQGSHSGSFFLNSRVDFSDYDKILFFPATFDRMKLSEQASNAAVRSWQKSSFKQMDNICAQFDAFAPLIFKRSKSFSPTHTGGLNVLALEFRILEFHPASERAVDAELDTVGQTYSNGTLGSIRIQAVLANAKTGALLAVIEDHLALQQQAVANNRTSHNLAWRTAFKHWLLGFEQDLTALKNAQHHASLTPSTAP